MKFIIGFIVLLLVVGAPALCLFVASEIRRARTLTSERRKP